MKSQTRIETTFGDLILALTEEATRFVPDESEACKLVSYILACLVYGSDPGSRTWH